MTSCRCIQLQILDRRYEWGEHSNPIIVCGIDCLLFFYQTLSLSASTTDIHSKFQHLNRVPRSTSASSIQHIQSSRYDTHRSNGSMDAASTSLAATDANDNIDDLVQNIIYAFTGTEGKYLKKDIIVGGLKLDPKVRLQNEKHRGMLVRLAEVAYYHDQVQSFTDSSTGRSPIGLLGQGLITNLRQELTSYYGIVAMLQEQVRKVKLSRDA